MEKQYVCNQDLSNDEGWGYDETWASCYLPKDCLFKMEQLVLSQNEKEKETVASN